MNTPRPQSLAAIDPGAPALVPTAERRHLRPMHAVASAGTRLDERGELERVLLSLLPRVRIWLYRLLGPRGAIDDATQDVLVELSTSLHRFEGRSSVETFAHRITVRVAYRYYAKPQRVDDRDPDTEASGALTPEAELVRQQTLTKLHRCLEKLPARRRTAFVLCAIEGLTPQEAALVEGTSAGSMRARYMHAREELSRMLASLRAEGGQP